MADTEEQLRTLNLRLARLEEAVRRLSGQRSGDAEPVAAPRAAPHATTAQDDEDRFFRDTVPQGDVAPAKTRPPDLARTSAVSGKTSSEDLSVTQIMGWTGATLLVLAAAYLIRLVYDTGWLTPTRQIGLAVMGGLGLVVAGLRLRHMDRHYASLLPAGGLVVFFLAIYGAHLYYQLIGAQAAAVFVIGNCLLALWLGRLFASELYALFAVVGSYSAPLLLRAMAGTATDLAIYFSAWSVVFSVYAIALGNRRPYLVAAYLALLAFQLAWEQLGRQQWGVAVAFQTLQFAIFLTAAIVFSIRHLRPLTQNEGLAHLPLLLLFYALQYHVLDRHVPHLAPWVALGSAAVLLLAYGVARVLLKLPLEAGGLIVGSYCALVLFHAGYLELLPERWAPWVVALAIPPAAWLVFRGEGAGSFAWPFKFLLGGLLALNWLRVVALGDTAIAGEGPWLSLLYTAELYAAYFAGRGHLALKQWVGFALYAAHLGLMGEMLRQLDNALLISLGWGALALATLVLAFRTRDQALGKSSLFIFAASLAKVILFDLTGAAPLVRIGSLVVVGIALYAGGMLYKQVAAMEH